MDQIGRRRLLLASAALALAPAVMAQQRGKVWRVGFLVSRSSAAIKRAGYDTAFLNALRELRYVDGKNVVVDWRFAEGNYDRLPALAADLVGRKVDLIAAVGNAAIAAIASKPKQAV